MRVCIRTPIFTYDFHFFFTDVIHPKSLYLLGFSATFTFYHKIKLLSAYIRLFLFNFASRFYYFKVIVGLLFIKGRGGFGLFPPFFFLPLFLFPHFGEISRILGHQSILSPHSHPLIRSHPHFRPRKTHFSGKHHPHLPLLLLLLAVFSAISRTLYP